MEDAYLDTFMEDHINGGPYYDECYDDLVAYYCDEDDCEDDDYNYDDAIDFYDNDYDR